jgi:hypothetical protein
VSNGGYACVDTQTNYAHCGGCNAVCPAGHGCYGGQCTCDQMICMDPGNPPPGGEAPQWINPQPAPLTFAAPTLHPFKQKCNDPFRCTPAVCFSLCSGGDCDSTMVCTPPVADGDLEPTFDVYMGFLAEPLGSDAVFDLQITPVSGPGCSDELTGDGLAEWLESGELGAGAPVTFEVTVEAPVEESSSGGGGYYCSGAVGFCENCGYVEACCSASDCYYVTGDGSEWPCNGTDCQSAAQAVVNYCCPPPP